MTHSLLVLVTLTLAACSTTPDRPEPEIGKVSTLYNQGMTHMEEGNFPKAVHTFEELERQHPYSGWSTRGKMMIAYAHFRMNNYDESLATIESFTRLHPGHENLDYMYYLSGLNHYYRISDVTRDQGHTHKALEAFEELVRRFPNSKYARDAKLKITLTRDHIAGQEMAVGRFYQQQQRHLAAINRFKVVVDKYERTAQTPEALYRLTESYLALGLNEQAQKAAAVLGYNYPSSDWYEDAYALMTDKKFAKPGKKKSWATQVLKGVKDLF